MAVSHWVLIPKCLAAALAAAVFVLWGSVLSVDYFGYSMQVAITDAPTSQDLPEGGSRTDAPILPRSWVPFPEPLPESGYRTDGFCGLGMPDVKGNPSRCPSEDEAMLAGIPTGSCCSKVRNGTCVGFHSSECQLKMAGPEMQKSLRLTPEMQVESLSWAYWADKFQHKREKVRIPSVATAGYSKLRALGRGKPCALLLGAGEFAAKLNKNESAALMLHCDIFTMNLGILHPTLVPDFAIGELKRFGPRLIWLNVFSDAFENGRYLRARLANTTFITNTPTDGPNSGRTFPDSHGLVGPMPHDIIASLFQPGRRFYSPCLQKIRCTHPGVLLEDLTNRTQCLPMACGNSFGLLVHFAAIMGYSQLFFMGFSPESGLHFYDKWSWIWRDAARPTGAHNALKTPGKSVYAYAHRFCQLNHLNCTSLGSTVLAKEGMRSSTVCAALGNCQGPKEAPSI